LPQAAVARLGPRPWTVCPGYKIRAIVIGFAVHNAPYDSGRAMRDGEGKASQVLDRELQSIA